ncbi:MAG: hypothetical protein A2X94_13675 [Bdellovibrionales bacterium GWB1_55_8]|nr:MAG: hypothetical protein A2X94_13675 [Bdellovibrionales bacterium GWB1_55_8]
MNYQVTALTFLLIAPVAALSDTCPPPSSSIDPSVSAAVSFDKKTGLYTYEYEVQNGDLSQIPLRFFSLQISEKPSEIQSPRYWLPEFMTLAHMPAHLLWSSTGKANALGIGRSLNGFRFQSPLPPGAVQYNAEGKTGIPASSPPEPGAANDEPEPNCPGWDFDNPRFQTLVTGLTTGPLPPDTASVPIRFRGEGGAHPRWPVNPHADKGKVSIIVLSTRNFNTAQIDLTTIKFGPGKATPLSSKVTRRRAADDNASEREDWEKQVIALEGENAQNTTHSNLLLTFDLATLEIKCVLDKALFFTAKTTDGKNVVGSVSTKLVGCDVKHPDVRPKPAPKLLPPKVTKYLHGQTMPPRRK